MSKKAARAEPVVYCGPTIKGVARQFTTYIDDIPDALAERQKAIPAIGALIVPLSALAKTRLALERSGTTESVIYSTVQKSL